MSHRQPSASVDYRVVMKKVEQLVGEIERDEDVVDALRRMANQIVGKFRKELGFKGGRLYQRDGEDYELRAVFGEAKVVDEGLRVPRTYPSVDRILMRGVAHISGADPSLGGELEDYLGIGEVAGVRVGGDDFLLTFDLVSGHPDEDVLFSLGILRYILNQVVREGRVEDIFRQAQEIQASILPKRSPRFANFDIAGRTASMEQVGGDFFDYIELSPKSLGLAIADVSGHGLPAALQVRDIYVGLRMGLSREFKIVRTIERLNRIIHGSTLTSRFVSLFYGELEDNGNFIYVNAGHPPPLHLRADGSVQYLDVGGPVLGPLPEAFYERGFVHLRPGDSLVAYSDGLTEALRASDGEELGVARLLDVIRSHGEASASSTARALCESIDAWTGGAPANDDRTVVVVKFPTER